jgi:hypothetical protein
MGKSERKAYLAAIRSRYRKASRAQKTKILDEFCAVCGYHRKYALRRVNQTPKRAQPRKPGRASQYTDEGLLAALRAIWLATDQMASKRLVVALALWLPHYEAVHGALDDKTRAKLLGISPATIDRLLKPVRAQAGRRGLAGTKPGTLLKRQIPLQTDTWDLRRPGFVEADTVAHCGDSLAGSFVWSLTLTDIYSSWTECRALWNKGAHGVITQIKNIQKALPFKLLGFDADNGSEFLNWHLVRYFQHPRQRVQFTRSRPYRKNDNAHVEQKNWSCVRQLFGYERFDQPALVRLMNDLYANEFSLLNNYFCPSMKLIEKKRLGAKIIRRHSTPQTPMQRLLDHPEITPERKAQLQRTYSALNPFELSATIQAKLRAIFKRLR